MIKRTGFIMLATGTAVLIAILLAQLLAWDLSKKVIILSSLAAFMVMSLGTGFIFMNHPEKKRKKMTNLFLIISVVLLAVGYICTRLHILGARVELIAAVFIFCFTYGTLAFKNKYEKWKVYTRSARDAFFLSTFDFLGIGFLFLGMLFKFQRWPWADNMITVGFAVLAIGTLAWNQKFKKEVIHRKEAEDQLKETLSEINRQKHLVEEKQQEVLDSIHYAKRIQTALLPPEKYIDKTLKRLIKNQ